MASTEEADHASPMPLASWCTVTASTNSDQIRPRFAGARFMGGIMERHDGSFEPAGAGQRQYNPNLAPGGPVPPSGGSRYNEPPGGQSPQDQQYQVGRPPADKSVGAALVLTFLFGGLGLFYSSVLGGIVMTVVELLTVIIAIVTLGFGLVLFAFVWPATMLWGALSASRKHRDFEMWRAQYGATYYHQQGRI
jgi:hypothetical protein